MDHRESGRCWEKNAHAWTVLARAGHDIYRDYLNTPAFLEMLPEVNGLRGLDIGCGEGHNTRLAAARGARMTAVDISKTFLMNAARPDGAEPLPGQAPAFANASAVELPFPAKTFDFATSFMCLMDVPEPDRALREAFRVLRPGGFLQFSITHPCYTTPHRRNLRNEDEMTYAIEVGNYFDFQDGALERWIFHHAPEEERSKFPVFEVPIFNFTISQWFNMILEAGFYLDRVNEPRPDAGTIAQCPELQDAGIVAYFLHIRARKPGN